MLVSAKSRRVRQRTMKNIICLCTNDRNNIDISSMIHQILINAELPFWSSSIVDTCAFDQQLLLQSIEYFELRCYLSENLGEKQQIVLGIDAKTLLQDEFDWLSAYSLTTTNQNQVNAVLLLGHLKFTRTLLTCENIDKYTFGKTFIDLLVDRLLFPASKHSSCRVTSTTNSFNTSNTTHDRYVPEPKCSTRESRLAAYDILVEFVRHCENNLNIIANKLIDFHHRTSIDKLTEWEVRTYFQCSSSIDMYFYEN
jgi:ubiquitin carboxyl-terminal hydrolase 9/24